MRHAEHPAGQGRCIRGRRYPVSCRGGHIIMLAGERQKVTGPAAEASSFRKIAGQTGLSKHAVSRIVHR